MNQISHLAVTMSRLTYDKDGKATQFKRHFANLNTQATTEQIKSFKSLLNHMYILTSKLDSSDHKILDQSLMVKC